MKIKNGFILRDVGNKTFVVAVGELSKTFNGMITLNETGKYIWQLLDNEITEEEIVAKIIGQKRRMRFYSEAKKRWSA